MRWQKRLGVGLIAIAIVATACTGSTTTTTTTTSTTTTTIATTTSTSSTTTLPAIQRPVGGEAIIVETREPSILNGLIPGGEGAAIVDIISQTYAAGVQDVDGFTLELIPELVTELPTVANGGVVVNDDGTMTVKYQIVDDARWSDGTPLTGDDFQFTLETILNPDLPITKTGYEDIFTSTAGERTFEYTMAVPTLQHELLFDEILPKHAVEGSDFLVDWNDTRWPSAGPFVLDEWTRGESLTVVRNDEYWKIDPETTQQLPYLDAVTFRFVADEAAARDLFAAREADVYQPEGGDVASSVATIDSLAVLEPQGAVVEVLSGPVWEHLNFQFGEARLERNPASCTESREMRVAVMQAIDRDVITRELIGGYIDPLESYVAPFSPTISLDAWAPYQTDANAAQQSYASATAGREVPCSVVFTTTSTIDARVRMSELFVEMFAAAGIPFENQLEANQFFFGETLSAGRWDLGSWAWVGSPGFGSLVSIHDVFDPDAPPPAGSNYYRWGAEGSSVVDETTERFAEIRDAMNSTVDEQELVDLIQEAETIIGTELVIIPLYGRPTTAAVWADEIAAFKHNPSSAGYTWNVEGWYRADQ